MGDRISRTDIMKEWRFVDSDLYNIKDRVVEYDADAALVVSERDRELAIARKVPNYKYISNTEWILARPLGLYGEPDARVIQIMRESDNRNRSAKQFFVEMERAGRNIEREKMRSMRDDDMDYDQLAWSLRKDFGRQDQIAI